MKRINKLSTFILIISSILLFSVLLPSDVRASSDGHLRPPSVLSLDKVVALPTTKSDTSVATSDLNPPLPLKPTAPISTPQTTAHSL